MDVARERRLGNEFKPQLRADADERRGPLRRRATDRLLPRVDGVAVPRRAHRAPARRLRGLLGRRRAAARGRPVRRVVLVGAHLVRGDLGLGERRPRRHALEELAGRDGVLHGLLGELLKVEPFALEHLAVQLEKPRRQVAALAEHGRHVVLACA